MKTTFKCIFSSNLVFCAAVAGLLGISAGCATRSAKGLPSVVELRPQAELPDPLVTQGGQQITSAKQWFKERRPELAKMFQHYMYGQIPPAPTSIDAQVNGTYPDFLDGKATMKVLTLHTGTGGAPRINLLLVVPNQGPKPAPVFLVMNFCGNQAVTTDPRVPLTQSWMGDSCKGSENGRASDAARGAQAADWPLAEIVQRGYALATFHSADIDPDRAEVSSGIYEWLAKGDAGLNNPTNRGTIAAWAWGYQRCVDYLVKDPEVDAKRIAAVGHSRNGKTALLATAFDERIAMAIPNQAGCGGSAPSRGKVGESVKAINDRFPHWFNAEFKQFNGAPERLPFDQHCLVAMCAPRPVLFSAAEGDQWANPAGQFEVLKAAEPVYRLLGVEALTAKEMPPLGRLINSRLGYYIREGKHALTAGEWRVFLDFADKNLRPR